MEALTWTLLYYLLSLVLYTFLPGNEVMGTELAAGGKLKYRFNCECQGVVLGWDDD